MKTEVKAENPEMEKLVNDLRRGFSNLAEKLKANTGATVADTGAAMEMFKKAFTKAEKDELAKEKAADLQIVKKLCKKHGFSASSLKGSLVTRAPKKKNEIEKGSAK